MDAGVPAVVANLVADQLSRGWGIVVASLPGSDLAESLPQTDGAVDRRCWRDPASRRPHRQLSSVTS
jgi:hypothetical protein